MPSNIRQEFIKGQAFTLPNVKTEWAYLVEPDVKYGKSQWCITARLEEAMATSLKEVGFNVRHTAGLPGFKGKESFKEGDEKYYYMQIYSKTDTARGQMNPPRVVDANAQPLDGNKVGNGSICNVKIYAKYCEVDGTTYLPAYLNSVQVVKLVEYVGDSVGFEPVDGGNTPSAVDIFGPTTNTPYSDVLF